MHHKRGFLLIECCVYIAFCAILTATLMRWISQTILEAGQHTTMIQKGVTHTLVHDVLMRDIQSMPCDQNTCRIDSALLIWKVDDTTAIGWYMDHERLMRKEGFYDTTRNQWGKHHMSTVAYNVNAFKCSAHKNEQGIQGIEITLGMDGSQPISRYVRLRNGRCYAES